MCNQAMLNIRGLSRLTSKSGDRLTRRQRNLLSEIAALDEGVAYELSFIVEPNWWFELWQDGKWDGEVPSCIFSGSFSESTEEEKLTCDSCKHIGPASDFYIPEGYNGDPGEGADVVIICWRCRGAVEHWESPEYNDNDIPF